MASYLNCVRAIVVWFLIVTFDDHSHIVLALDIHILQMLCCYFRSFYLCNNFSGQEGACCFSLIVYCFIVYVEWDKIWSHGYKLNFVSLETILTSSAI